MGRASDSTDSSIQSSRIEGGGADGRGTIQEGGAATQRIRRVRPGGYESAGDTDTY